MNTADLLLLARVRSMCESRVARSVRLAAGLSLREVGQSVAASPSSIYRWETGQRAPRGRAAIRYAKLLAALLEPSER